MTTLDRKLPPILKGGTLDDSDPYDPRLPMLLSWGLPGNGARVRYTVAATGAAFKDFTIEFYGVWEYHDNEPLTGRQIAVNTGRAHELIDVWLRRVRLKGAHACIEEIYHPTHGWQLMVYGIHLDPESARVGIVKRLATALHLGEKMQRVLSKSGRPPKATVDPETIRAWSSQYDNARAALLAILKNYKRKQQLAKHNIDGRVAIIKKAFPGIGSKSAETLAAYTSVGDVALRYTAWRCSGIEIGAWKTTQYRQELRRSDKANAIKRGGNGIKLSGR